MAVQVELLVLAAQPVVHLAQLVRMASTVPEEQQVMAATAARALTELLEQLE